jgi:hypothetical protein
MYLIAKQYRDLVTTLLTSTDVSVSDAVEHSLNVTRERHYSLVTWNISFYATISIAVTVVNLTELNERTLIIID